MAIRNEDDELDVVFSDMSPEQIAQSKQQMDEFLAEGLDEAVTEDDSDDTVQGAST